MSKTPTKKPAAAKAPKAAKAVAPKLAQAAEPKRAAFEAPAGPPPLEPAELGGAESLDELLALLTDDALAVAPRVDGDADLAELTGKARSNAEAQLAAYVTAHEARIAWLLAAMRAIARHRDPRGDERLLSIWRGGDRSPEVRGLAALALVGSPEEDAADVGTESAIAAVAGDLPALVAAGDALARLSVVALLRGDPARAYDAVAPLFAPAAKAAKGKGTVTPLHLQLADVLAERVTSEADPRWADLAGKLLTEPSLQTFALSILTTLRSPRSEDALLALLEQQIKAPHVRETPVRLLGYLKSKRAADPLVRALVSPGLAAWMGDICAALKTIDEPAVIPKLHAARAKIEQGHRKKIDEVVAHLERPRRGGG